jgi:enoyl-CoA hydratase/carnithine racemase
VISGDVSAFSAGADVSSALPDGPAGVREQLDVHSEMEQLFRRLEQLPVVKIAKIEGPAIGAGLVLASLCEIRIMTPQAFISLTELDFGIPFSMGGLPRLVRLVGLTAAADMLLTSRRVHGDEALRIGFASRLVAPERIDEIVTEYLTTLASRSPFLIANAVRRIRETAEDLAPSWRSDIDSLVLATYDALSRQQSARYAKSITSPHRAP